MKTLFAIFLIILGSLCYAQSDSLTLKDMEIPNSPGFILLDQAPSSIERPNNAKAFALSIFNSFAESSGIPNNYAVEFTPFWYFKQKNMNVLKYAGYADEEVHPFSSAKMVSISMAYINNTDSINGGTINNVAFGARTTLFKIMGTDYKKELIKANNEAVTKLKELQKEVTNLIGPYDPIDPVGYHIKEAKLLSQLEDSLKNNIGKVLERKPILAVDVAFAYNTFFLESNFSKNYFGRLGTWLTMNFSKNLNPENSNYINIYAIGRYLSDGTSKDEQDEYITQNFLDFGGKVEFEFSRLSIGYEYIYRDSDKNTTYRSTGQLKFKLSDNLYLTGAFGKNFGEVDNLVSLFGVNWGLNAGSESAKIE